MKVKRTNLTDQLMGFEETQATPSRKAIPPILINYDKIIEKQSQLLESLYKQCAALRQKINRIKSEELFVSDNKLEPQKNMEKFAEMIENALLKEIASLLEIPQSQISKNKVLQSIKRLKWQRQKISEPIFIESKKEVRIPVPVEILNIVEKVVYKEKIVVQQKIVEVPVFRQKIVERFSKIEEMQILPFTISKLSSEVQKLENSSGFEQSDDSLFLGTNSVLKVDPREEVNEKKESINKEQKSRVQSRKNFANIQQKSQIQRPQSRGYKQYGNSKKLTLSDVREDHGSTNRSQYYDPNPQKFNSRSSKQSIKSPKYPKQEQRNNYSKQDYNDQDDYTYQRRNDNYDKGQRQERTYYRNSNEHNNRTVVSPKNYQEKYREEEDKYAFDKNKFLDSSKINPSNNKNIKRRDKYDFNDHKYRDR